MKDIIYWIICIIFFALYFHILKFIWNTFIPFNTITDLVSLFIMIFVNIPLSVVSTEKIFTVIKEK